jgi:hypothetical protein
MQPDYSSAVQQYQGLAGAGDLGQHASFGVLKIHTGTGGMVGPGRVIASGGTQTGVPAVYGMPGCSVTMIGTGLYDIRHPPIQMLTVIPTVSAPSGQFWAANIEKQPSGGTASGIMRLNVGRNAGPGASGIQPAAPPSGVRFDLVFFAHPTNSQGLAQF